MRSAHSCLNFFFSLLLLALIFPLLTSCNPTTTASNLQKVKIPGRNNSQLYSIEIPKNWIIQQSHSNGYEEDTTLPLIEFFINDVDERIRITVHNFPNQEMAKRIPPIQQIERWKKQLTPLSFYTLLNQTFGGFVGILLEAEGFIQNKKTGMLAWSLQLDQSLYRHLEKILTYDDSARLKEAMSDVTIKAVGPKVLMDKYKKDILQMGLSFKLVDEIPYSL